MSHAGRSLLGVFARVIELSKQEMICMSIQETFRGIVHGSTIQLNQSPGVPDGMEVADDLDAFIAWSDQQRKQDRPGF